ncbi:MAG: YbjN domain-containing protein [Deltaproteobacteria bacterium]|jgi:hypothetical protein|nr:YbjN domain-containing protein [Deltaproteobacteria bacterium]
MPLVKSALLTLALAALTPLFQGTLMAQTEAAPKQSSENAKIYIQPTLPEILSIMKAQNYNVELYEDTEVIAWFFADDHISLISTDKPTSLNFYTYVEGDEFTFEDANKWNRDYIYSKTYLDDDNDPALELDLDLTGGVTEARIISFLENCEDSFKAWIKEAS